ncbi:MAG: glycosyltransferase family 1 protein [Desulfovibrio sp.]|nr:glycosyltransferase family 1 protein [Desulfovibrio sp.]
MRTLFFFPPLNKLSGGMAVIARMSMQLRQAGFSTFLVPREDTQLACDAAPDVPIISWNNLRFACDDIWVVPEGWPQGLLAGLQAHVQCVIYVQNWAYLLRNIPATTLSSLPVQFMAVSHPVAWYIRETTGRQSFLLRPGIDTNLFHPHPERQNCPAKPITERLKVAWMPRKNKALTRQIIDVLSARGQDIEWIEIHGRSQKEVAELMRNSHIFLATGFPEGCPLPPLEAMASGCIVAGWGGLGGWDYMRQTTTFPGAFEPWWPQEDVLWGGNGFYAADADILGAVFALEQACRLLRTGGPELALMRRHTAMTVQRYSIIQQALSVTTLWSLFEKNIANNRSISSLQENYD